MRCALGLWVYFYLLDGIHFELIAEPFSIRQEADLYEYTGHGKSILFSGFDVLPFEGGDELLADNGCWLRIIQKRHALAVGKKLKRRFKTSVAAAYYRDVLIGKERAITRSAVSETLLIEFRGSRYFELAAPGAARDQKGCSFQRAPVF